MTLKLKPQLQEVAKDCGVSVTKLLEQDLEQRWLNPLARFSSIGLGESDLSAKDSKAWLKSEWDKKLY